MKAETSRPRDYAAMGRKSVEVRRRRKRAWAEAWDDRQFEKQLRELGDKIRGRGSGQPVWLLRYRTRVIDGIDRQAETAE